MSRIRKWHELHDSEYFREYRTSAVLSLYHNCDSITIRLRYDDTMTHSTTTVVIEITICVRFDCETTTTRLRRKIDMLFFACVELEAGARDTS